MSNRFAKSSSVSRRLAMAGAGLFVIMAGPALADVKAGVDAWSEGDFNRAVREWQVPAQNGDVDAMFNLAQAYRLGRGVTADVDRAKELYAEAAQKGHVKAADNYGLLLFQQGQQVDAMPLIRAAAERGDPRAQYVLGLSHFNADYAEKDWVRAFALLTLAQSAGLPQANDALSQMSQYVPVAQQQEAQTLARQIDAEAKQRRAAELAALDLAAQPTVTQPTVTQPTVTQATPTSVALTSRRSDTVEPAAVSQAKRDPVLVQSLPQQQAPAPVRVARAQPKQVVPVPAAQRPRMTGDWNVQLGAFGVAGNADRLWAKLSGTPALSGASKRLVPAGRVTKLLASGFNTRAEAQAACASLKQQGQGCLVTKG